MADVEHAAHAAAEAGVPPWVWGASVFVVLIGLTAFEILVALLQAFIFTILTAVYIGGAAHPEH